MVSLASLFLDIPFVLLMTDKQYYKIDPEANYQTVWAKDLREILRFVHL